MFHRTIHKKKVPISTRMHFEEYLTSIGEPPVGESSPNPYNHDTDIAVNKFLMKRRLRQLARDIRDHIPKGV